MQESFGFFGEDVARWTEPLTQTFGRLVDVPRRRPLGQLVKSPISSRTRDETSPRAYRRLGRRWPRAVDMAGASPPAIERVTASAPFLNADDLLQLFAQMKLLGQTVCRFDEPHCPACPLAGCCRTAKAVDANPRRS